MKIISGAGTTQGYKIVEKKFTDSQGTEYLIYEVNIPFTRLTTHLASPYQGKCT